MRDKNARSAITRSLGDQPQAVDAHLDPRGQHERQPARGIEPQSVLTAVVRDRPGHEILRKSRAVRYQALPRRLVFFEAQLVAAVDRV